MTKLNHNELISALHSAGWKYELSSQDVVVPSEVVERYSWLPPSVLNWAVRFHSISSEDDKSWFLTPLDYAGQSDCAYCWNEWEKMCLEEADGDDDWCREIAEFWDANFPIWMSVRDGYQYLAVAKSDLEIVRGASPEFEEVETIVGSIHGLFSSSEILGQL